MRCGAPGGDAVTSTRLEVGRGIEPADEPGASSGHGGLGIGATRAALDQEAAAGGIGHAGRCRSDGTVVVEHREHHRLEHDALGEASGHGQNRRVREEQFALGVAGDVAAESVPPQPVGHLAVDDDAGAHEMLDRGVVETEAADGVEHAIDAGDDAVGTTGRESAGEDLEHGSSMGDTGFQCRGDHREFVVIGQQRRRGRFHVFTLTGPHHDPGVVCALVIDRRPGRSERLAEGYVSFPDECSQPVHGDALDDGRPVRARWQGTHQADPPACHVVRPALSGLDRRLPRNDHRLDLPRPAAPAVDPGDLRQCDRRRRRRLPQHPLPLHGRRRAWRSGARTRRALPVEPDR